MKILVLNCGSSSLKYQLFDMNGEVVLAKGLVERIGIAGSRVKHSKGADSVARETDIPDHTAAIKIVLDLLTGPETGVLKNLDEITAVGHRIVHGGEKNDKSALVTDSVIKDIEDCISLAPLHNPANLMGIRAMQKALPGVPGVAVFDTAFHQTMPPKAFIYGIPYEYYEKDKVRRYAFHGTSHAFVSARAAEILGKSVESLRIITCHLGNGSSLAAVDCGKSVDCSLGMGTTPGILMGTRCGDVDASVILYLAEKEKDLGKVSDILHKQSGLLGVSGISSDLRDIEEAADKGNERAKLANEILYTTIRKYIAAYAAVMSGVDAIVFTAGIGENSDRTRKGAVEGLEFMGVKLDDSKNNGFRGKEAIISAADSKVKILVVPTNEELMIARDTRKLAG
ncbi:MAG: acetate kinase [Synergistaceae bacterium]|jgi:acetate kinase|nr:acetate kinase [Synergistaceae bacterium]